MAKFAHSTTAVLLMMLSIGILGTITGDPISCVCNAGNDTCTPNGNGSCYYMSIQVDREDHWNYSGCADTPLDPKVNYSLTIVTIRAGLAYVAVMQCADAQCNGGSVGRWSSIGIREDCIFDVPSDVITVNWDEGGNVTNDVSGWCHSCQHHLIRQPNTNETLCEWLHAVRNESFHETIRTQLPLDKTSVYISGGVLGGVFLLGMALSVVEFLKAMKEKRTKSGQKKAKVTREIKLASPLQPTMIQPLPGANAKVPGAPGKEPAAAPSSAKESAKSTEKPKTEEPKSGKTASKSSKKPK